MAEQDNERFKNIYKIEESGEEASFNRLPANYSGSFKILEEVPVYYENGHEGPIIFRESDVDKKNIKRIKVTSVSNSAFSGCISLERVYIPSSVTAIGHSAFMGCSALKQIDIPASVTSIGPWAFEGCSALEEIHYYNKGKLKSLNWSVSSLDKHIKFYSLFHPKIKIRIPGNTNVFFKQDHVEHLTFNAGITEIPQNACSHNIYVKTIDIPSSVTSIGEAAFEGCSELEKIDIHSPASVTSIGNSAFWCCSALKQIDIPSSVTSISSWAFKGCSALEKIDIPSSVTFIGDSAFEDCPALKQIHLPASVTYIGSSAFSGCEQLEKLVILGHNTEISFPILKNARTGIKIRIDSRNYCIKDHIIYDNSCSRLLEFLNPNTNEDYCTTEEIVIGDKTKSIGDRAFHNLSGIKKIVIPETVIQIGENAFQQGDSVDEIFIRIDPAKAKIEKSAFDGINANCRIYVPVGTRYAYSHHEAFIRFKDNIIIEEPDIP